MASDLSRWIGALSDLDQAEKEKTLLSSRNCLLAKASSKKPSRRLQQKQTQQQRYELQQWISLTLGKSKWDGIRMEGQIRKRRQELCTHKGGVVSL